MAWFIDHQDIYVLIVLIGSTDILALVPTEEPDDVTLHCVSVSEFCIKIGWITVSRTDSLRCS